jgi:hypothetical protein
MTIGGLNHKLEWCVRGALQDNGHFPGPVDLQNDGRSRRSNAWDHKATAVPIPVAVVHWPFIQRNGLIFPGGSILNGKKVDAMVMRKIGERSAIGRKAPVVSLAADLQEFAADSALGVEGKINDIVLFGFANDAQGLACPMFCTSEELV